MSETKIEQLPISYIEAVFGRRSSKVGVLKISQISQQNTCIGVSF